MITRQKIKSVYLACGFADLRKSIDGLALIVQESFDLDPFSPSLFVFCNRNKDKLKILHWEHNGFWLYYRRLERGKFKWPTDDNEQNIKIKPKEFEWILDGYEVRQGKAFKEVNQRKIV
ncbi:IS66 family insertion sequence element accessory protein TnpB [Haloplasma contractile]|uniref:2-C-methyl-D-erythritol 24-cyclodiphosphate synthase protein n=1 Tax=Haloplasma contractile SSD-17B TaxID=1033810 RepID=F7PSI6_9MOLU|nr:IS66 family insertion sequence element accessory protein TnpB [Haloplasma contractile]ERJ12624.1 2-C-methyl-D-erythritol 24-cyclodiphosphate synthase protein [Haloplasma contractile SSD-17B]